MVLTEASATTSGLPFNAIFVNPLGIPTPFYIRDLSVKDSNYLFADVNGDGTRELIVSAAIVPPPGEDGGQANVHVYEFATNENGFARVRERLTPEAQPQPLKLPTDCPMPTNSVYVMDVDGDTKPDFICLRPGTIDVFPGTGPEGEFGVRERNEFPFFQSSDPDFRAKGPRSNYGSRLM